MLGIFSSSRVAVKLPLRGVFVRTYCFRKLSNLAGTTPTNPALKLAQDPGQVLLELSKNPAMKRSVKAYTDLITSFTTVQPTRALELFEEMQQVGLHPNISTFNALLALAKKTSDLTLATSLVQKMKSQNVDPTLLTYTMLIELFASKMDEKTAMVHFEEMKKRNIPPNIRIYSTLIDVFSLTGDLDQGRQLFNEMKEKNLISTNDTDVINLSILIDIHCKLMQPEEALKFLRQMETRGILPHAKTYQQLILAFEQHHNTKQVFELADEMHSKNLLGTPLLYRQLMRTSLRAGYTQKALQFFHKIPTDQQSKRHNLWYQSLTKDPQFLVALTLHDSTKALEILERVTPKTDSPTLRE